MAELETALRYLRSPLAIRARSENIFSAGLAGKLAHFSIHLEKLEAAAQLVADVTRKRYPTLAVPVHGRMGHFRAAGLDRPATMAAVLSPDKRERARQWIDVIVVSVLLDAGAGDQWAYVENGSRIARSEGLAVASLYAFRDGLFASDRKSLRVDADGLAQITADELATAMQHAPGNVMLGFAGRASLLAALANAFRAHPDIFVGGRPGGILDSLGELKEVDLSLVFARLLEGMSSIWPARLTMAGHSLGDVWKHPAAGGDGLSTGYVPFHKLTQWLTYSLVEPLTDAGFVVKHVGALTGLPEYRNGGLFVDAGVLAPKHDGVFRDVHEPASELIVEWRALTVALLDRTADAVRKILGVTPVQMPLASVLEGGTWATGRELAARRKGGGSPIQIASDGTVF